MSEEPLGPFVFDTSAESWLARADSPEIQRWFVGYLERHPVYISAVTVIERLNGYHRALRLAESPESKARLQGQSRSYVGDPNRVLPVDVAVAAASAELLAMVPDPPSPPKRSHRAAESRADRLARWRFDAVVAATALVNRMPLMHDNPADFETLRTMIEIHPSRLPGLGPLDLYRCTRLGARRAVAR